MIEGRVAQILNERELVINRGQQDGVTIGMQFDVLASTSIEVVDPETGQLLGALDRPKVRLQATDIHEKFSICETIDVLSEEYAVRTASDFFRSRRHLPSTLKARETLPPLSEEESIVRTGDRAKQVAMRRAPEARANSG